MMPAMNGLELAGAVRSDGEKANIPIILVSGAQASIGRAHPTMYDAVFDKPNSQKLSKTPITTPVSLVMLPHIVFMRYPKIS